MPKRVIVLSWALLIVLLTGGAAEGLSGKNTVKSDDIKNNTIQSKDVKNDSLTGKDINESTLVGVTGPAGATGPAGPKGDTGATGPAGLIGYEDVTTEILTVPVNNTFSGHAECPTGKVATGGGYQIGPQIGDLDQANPPIVLASVLNANPRLWSVIIFNPSATTEVKFLVRAACVNAP